MRDLFIEMMRTHWHAFAICLAGIVISVLVGWQTVDEYQWASRSRLSAPSNGEFDSSLSRNAAGVLQLGGTSGNFPTVTPPMADQTGGITAASTGTVVVASTATTTASLKARGLTVVQADSPHVGGLHLEPPTVTGPAIRNHEGRLQMRLPDDSRSMTVAEFEKWRSTASPTP